MESRAWHVRTALRCNALRVPKIGRRLDSNQPSVVYNLSVTTKRAWEELFRVRQLHDRLAKDDWVTITADEIKSIARREPRLMTKFDTRESRPELLNGVTILPLSNGEYALLRGDGYCDVPAADTVKVWNKRTSQLDLVTLPWEMGPASESQALDMAYAAGILDDFFGEAHTRLTIRGRLRCPQFNFRFRCATREVPLVANGVQVEVDSGFEGQAIHLLEAKLGNRTNFHLRQLYFPLRMWSSLVPSKPVNAVFLTWSNRCISIRSFGFEPLDLYQSNLPLARVDYLLDEPDSIPSLSELLEETPPCTDTVGAPFPQADDMRRVIDIVDAIGAGLKGRATLASRYGFDGRQADYYANAAAYLGLLERSRAGFTLSSLGDKFLRAALNRRHETLLRQIVARPGFREVAEYVAATGVLPSTDHVAEIVASITSLTGATASRRARTVLAWFRWAKQITEAEASRCLGTSVESNGQYRLF